jgi:RNA polymerase sigma-70 factor (ECF subfamily)
VKPPVTISDAPARPESAGALDPAALHPPVSAATPDIAEVYKRHNQRIYRYCRAYLRHEADAQDAAQETFVRASQRLHQVTGDIGPYLTGIARNVCYDHRRYHANRCVSLDGEDRADPRQRPEHVAVERAVVDRLWVALNRNERVLLAHSFAGFSYEEISGITGMSAKAVSVAMTRARQRARRLATVASLALIGWPPAGWLRRLVARSGHVGLALATTEQAAVLAISLAIGIGAGNALTATPQASGEQQAATAPVALSPATVISTATSRVAANSATASTALVVQPPPPPPPPFHAARPILDNTAPGPQDVTVTAFTPSPQYSQDRTIFASGYRVGCASGCAVIFRSRDAGRSWTFLGFQPGGPVVLPPAYPADQSLYVATGSGLARSDDGGTSFRVVAPIVGPTVAAPDGAPGGARILMVGSQTPQLWVYSEARDSLAPGPAMPLGLLPDSLTLVDADHFVIAAHDATQNAPALGRTYFVECTINSCQTAAIFAGYAPGIQFVGPSSVRGLVAAFSGSAIYVSRDGGQTFRESSAPPGTITTASFLGAPTAPVLVIAYGRTVVSGAASALAISTDGGSTYTTLPSFSGATIVTTLGGLVDGHVLAYLAPGGSGGSTGLRCSSDGARTWASSC